MITPLTPAFRFYESADAGLNISDITGHARSQITKCLTSSQLLRGFDEDLAKFQEMADAPDDEGARGDASPNEAFADPEPNDGR